MAPVLPVEVGTQEKQETRSAADGGEGGGKPCGVRVSSPTVLIEEYNRYL